MSSDHSSEVGVDPEVPRPPKFPSRQALSGIAAAIGPDLATKWARASAAIHHRAVGQLLPLCGAEVYWAATPNAELVNCWSCAEAIVTRELLQREGFQA
jgi:hypothetical protein